ncbi:hypothetical protein EJ06DRAFT_280947 [Trichodelitschia bisporula]|uniref:Uncharacterized protein n=1 Tax=Trichodelitschia bisporula TaxID=703511 RepID=A0A6G1I5Z6_9PEZI|nr:hypothetical protein EJ06DRAFT_280947 [Trichodelitschia bisporula]
MEPPQTAPFPPLRTPASPGEALARFTTLKYPNPHRPSLHWRRDAHGWWLDLDDAARISDSHNPTPPPTPHQANRLAFAANAASIPSAYALHYNRAPVPSPLELHSAPSNPPHPQPAVHFARSEPKTPGSSRPVSRHVSRPTSRASSRLQSPHLPPSRVPSRLPSPHLPSSRVPSPRLVRQPAGPRGPPPVRSNSDSLLIWPLERKFVPIDVPPRSAAVSPVSRRGGTPVSLGEKGGRERSVREEKGQRAKEEPAHEAVKLSNLLDVENLFMIKSVADARARLAWLAKGLLVLYLAACAWTILAAIRDAVVKALEPVFAVWAVVMWVFGRR